MADIRTLADHLKISIGTVSRALNDRSGVNAQTRQRVLQAAVELGYVPNQSGRSLRRGATSTIGFVVETGAAANQTGDNFFFVLLDVMNEVLSRSGYDLVILPCHSADDPVEFLQRVIARGTVDAIVLTATRRQDRRIALLAASRMPFITLGRSETAGDYPWADLDFETVARRSVQELAALGHRRIALALPDTDAALGQHFLQGYRAGLAEAGIAADDGLILRVDSSEAGGWDFGQRIAVMTPRPTAAMICSEVATVGFYGALAQAGLAPGTDMSLVIFRENAQVRFLQPAPACFRADLPALGERLAGMVLELLHPQTPGTLPRQVIWPMTFVPGGTLRPPAG